MRGARPLLLGLALASTAPSRAVEPPAAPAGDLGRIDFPTSGAPAAQSRFVRGVLLLHSFEYDDAAAEFREARKVDSGFAMAAWGEAMTANHPIWMERDRDAARAALEKIAPTREERLRKAPTRRERLYLEAVEELYADGEKAERDLAYAAAMRRLHEEFPGDLEAASFYALALLGTCEGKRDFAVYMKAAAVAEEVFAKNPLHPGAVHYLIHSYDDPIHAPLGMRPARVYARIAPAAGHALHMPSHIFLASGMWDEVAASNEAAWKASLARAERGGLGPDSHNYHALQWLQYAYLQQGRFADAARLLATMDSDARASGSRRARTHLAAMRAAYLVETAQLNGDVAKMRADPDDSPAGAPSLFVDGLGALERGEKGAAEEFLARMRSGGGGEKESPGHAHGAAPPSGYGAAASPSSASVGSVLARELEACILFAKGEKEKAVALAREAASAEDSMTFEFGPPEIVKPSHEFAGELLLRTGSPAEARKEFEASLARAPRRALSLLGLARAARAAGDEAASRAAYAELREIWRHADPALAGLREARSSAPGS